MFSSVDRLTGQVRVLHPTNSLGPCLTSGQRVVELVGVQTVIPPRGVELSFFPLRVNFSRVPCRSKPVATLGQRRPLRDRLVAVVPVALPFSPQRHFLHDSRQGMAFPFQVHRFLEVISKMVSTRRRPKSQSETNPPQLHRP